MIGPPGDQDVERAPLATQGKPRPRCRCLQQQPAPEAAHHAMHLPCPSAGRRALLSLRQASHQARTFGQSSARPWQQQKQVPTAVPAGSQHPPSTMVQVIEGERASAKGHKLFSVTVLPDAGQTPAAVLCWHHGIGEHIGRYEKVFERLARAGVAVYSGDVVGHGKSEGHRAYIESYTDTVNEFLALCDWAAADVRKRYPGASPAFFIGGHSLGGLVAALVCHRDQQRWAGLLVCSPAMDVEMGLVLKIQAALGGLLAALVPRARIVPAVDPNDMNPDPKCVEQYCADPLNTVGNLPARTGNEVLKAMRWLRARWPDFTLPIYMHHGADDKCTSPKASQAFVAAASSTDKTANIVPGGYHEVLLTAGLADTLTDNMIQWIKERAAGPRPAATPGAGAAAGSEGETGATAKM